MNTDPLSNLACPICGGPVALQGSREQPLRPWQLRWRVEAGCCRTMVMEASTQAAAIGAIADHWPAIYGRKPGAEPPKPARAADYGVTCGHCGGPLWLISMTEREIGMPDDPNRFKALIGCPDCHKRLSGTGLTEPAATEEALRHWKDRNAALAAQEPA
jgi:hypothetical protein